MTLRGSLKDMGIVDLIQFPHTGRKTGVLIVASPDDDAKLFYRDGKLIHAEMDETSGLDVLTHMVDWKEGEFEFRPGENGSPDVTIEVGLHQAIMQAFKALDEKKLQEAGKLAETNKDNQKQAKTLKRVVRATDCVEYAALLSAEGETLAQTDVGELEGESPEALKKLANELAKNPPRSGFRRLFFEDDMGTAVVSRFSEDQLLLVLADEGANLGTVSMAVNRITTAILED